MSFFAAQPSCQARFANRRGFLQYSMATSAAVGLTGQTHGRSAAPRKNAAILFFLAGGPSHIDTYDMKPEATPEVRGPFSPITTSQPGFDVCELLPRHVPLAKDIAVVRSVTHNLSVHDDATHWIQTGYPLLNARQRGQTHPSQGALVSKLRGPNVTGMPAYVCVPEDYRTHMGFYEGAAFLGSKYLAVNAGGDPRFGKYHPPEFQLPVEVSLPRVEQRQELLHALDRFAAQADAVDSYRELSESQQAALELSTGPQARHAFDIAQEPEAVRLRYGENSYGQGALMARRLVEAGATFVVVNLYDKDVDWWDDHYTIEKNLRARLPKYDQAFATLVEDLTERGLIQDVLVGSFGEFGRSPRIDAGAGRGHWPRAMAAVLTGGGIRGGQIIGSTTPDGAEPRDRPLAPGDLLASIYRVMGIDHRTTVADRQGRPISLVPEGQPINDLFV